MTIKTCPDILRWAPPTWELFLGNEGVKKVLKRTLKRLRRQM
jgi:hypothetical protein